MLARTADKLFSFNFTDEIRFSKAIYYHFRPIPLPQPFQDATGGIGQYLPEKGYLELTDDMGFTSHYTVNPDFVKETLPKLLNGKKLSYNQWRETLYWQIRNSGFQSAQAVQVGIADLMMLDILSQRAGKPLHRFLGADKDWAAAYKGGGSILLEDDQLVEEMERYVSEGFSTVKFKVGSGRGKDMERDLRRIRKVRQALGDNVNIAVDANQSWQEADAVRFAALTEPYHLAWIEEPIHSHDYNGIKRLKDQMTQRLAFGESMRIYYAYETYVEKGVDILQPSLGRMSRIDDLIRIRDLARDNGLIFQSGGRTAYNAIFGCLYNENEPVEFHAPISEPMHSYMLGVPDIRSGKCFVQNDIPGIPVRINLEKLEREGYLESKTYYVPDRFC